MLPWDLAQLGTVALFVVVFGIILVESGLLIGLLLPGDSVLFTAGLLAAGVDSPLALPLLAVIAFAAAVLGDGLGYYIGLRLGRPYLVRGLRRYGTSMLTKAERLYHRHGWFAIVVARWIPWIRTIIPAIAGIGRMSYPRFLTANATGAALWAVGLVVLGYVSHTIPRVYQLSLAAMGASIIAIIIYAIKQRHARTRPSR